MSGWIHNEIIEADGKKRKSISICRIVIKRPNDWRYTKIIAEIP